MQLFKQIYILLVGLYLVTCCILAKAAEVVSTIVQNNPKSQQLVMESNGLEPLLTNFKSDSCTNARTKALGAISCKYHSVSCGV